MNISYEGIGQWAATFACTDVSEGQVVKVSGSGTVAACAANGVFDGVVLSVGRDGKACSVAMGGMATVSYSGNSAPERGFHRRQELSCCGCGYFRKNRDHCALS